jgi:hypothetical protein
MPNYNRGFQYAEREILKATIPSLPATNSPETANRSVNMLIGMFLAGLAQAKNMMSNMVSMAQSGMARSRAAMLPLMKRLSDNVAHFRNAFVNYIGSSAGKQNIKNAKFAGVLTLVGVALIALYRYRSSVATFLNDAKNTVMGYIPNFQNLFVDKTNSDEVTADELKGTKPSFTQQIGNLFNAITQAFGLSQTVEDEAEEYLDEVIHNSQV